MLVLYNKYCSTIVKFAEYVPFLPDWLDDFWLYTCFSYVGLMLCWVISKFKNVIHKVSLKAFVIVLRPS